MLFVIGKFVVDVFRVVVGFFFVFVLNNLAIISEIVAHGSGAAVSAAIRIMH